MVWNNGKYKLESQHQEEKYTKAFQLETFLTFPICGQALSYQGTTYSYSFCSTPTFLKHYIICDGITVVAHNKCVTMVDSFMSSAPHQLQYGNSMISFKCSIKYSKRGLPCLIELKCYNSAACDQTHSPNFIVLLCCKNAISANHMIMPFMSKASMSM